jgi:hypothetical protein
MFFCTRGAQEKRERSSYRPGKASVDTTRTYTTNCGSGPWATAAKGETMEVTHVSNTIKATTPSHNKSSSIPSQATPAYSRVIKVCHNHCRIWVVDGGPRSIGQGLFAIPPYVFKLRRRLFVSIHNARIATARTSQSDNQTGCQHHPSQS